MAKDYFQFKRFTIHQSLCAMKVGTDGTLLGAWARGGNHVLDIGTGTGIIALMMAQRYPSAKILCIDIDEGAVKQAKANVEDSTFIGNNGSEHRIEVRLQGVEETIGQFDSIVSNPPYFDASLKCSDKQRNTARHTDTLSFSSLFRNAWRLLSDDGEFSIIIPMESKSKIDAEAVVVGFFKIRECLVKTLPHKQPKRVLMAFRKHPSSETSFTEQVIEDYPGKRSEWYSGLTSEFYL